MSTKSAPNAAPVMSHVAAEPVYFALEPRIAFDAALAATLEHLVEPHPVPSEYAAVEGGAALSFKDVRSLADAITPTPALEARDVMHERPAANAATTIVFIDSSVSDPAVLAAAAPRGAEFVVIDPASDGLAQIAHYLDGRHDIAAIHIVSHGHDGALDLGATSVTTTSLMHDSSQATALANIGKALAADGDILLYGCDVAASDAGKAFVSTLAQMTGADVAASSDKTGATALGGDWDLEVRQGTIDARVLDAPEWQGTLAPLNISATTAPIVKDNTGATVSAVTSGGVTRHITDVTKMVGAKATWQNAGYIGSTPIDVVATVVSVADTNPGTGLTFDPSLYFAVSNGDDPSVRIESSEVRIKWQVFAAGTNIPAAGDVGFFIRDIDAFGNLYDSSGALWYVNLAGAKPQESVRADFDELASYQTEALANTHLTVGLNIDPDTGATVTNPAHASFGKITATNLVATEFAGSVSGIKFNWNNVNSWEVTYRVAPPPGSIPLDGPYTFNGTPDLTNNFATQGQRFFDHDGDGDLTFVAPYSVSMRGLDLDGNNSTAAGTAYQTTFTEGAAAVSVVDDDLDISGLDTNIASATVQLTNAKPGDHLLVSGSAATSGTVNGLAYTVTASGGTITVALTGVVTDPTIYEAALKQITFANTTVDPDPTSRSIAVAFSNGTVSSNTAFSTIQVLALNQGPHLDLGMETTYASAGSGPGTGAFLFGHQQATAATRDQASFAVLPANVTQVVGAEVAGSGIVIDYTQGTHAIITGAGTTSLPAAIAANDFISMSFTTTGSMPESWITHVTKLNAGGPNYQFAVAISNDGFHTATLLSKDNASPSNGSPSAYAPGYPNYDGRDFNLTAGTTYEIRVYIYNVAGGAAATAKWDDFYVFFANDPAGNETTFTEGGAPVAITSAGREIEDVDTANMVSGLVTLTNKHTDDQLLISGVVVSHGDIGTVNGIAYSVVETGGSIAVALSGSATKADYATALSAITFNNSSAAPDITDRLVDVTVNDGTHNSNIATTTIHIVPTNDAPIANNNGPSAVTEDIAATGNVLADDTDPDGDALTVTQFTVAGVSGTYAAGETATVPGVGTLVIEANGTFVFTPAHNHVGPVPTATYTITDGTASSSATLSFADISPVNDTPIATDNLYATLEDTSVSGNVLTDDTGAGIDRDIEGTSLRVESFTVAGDPTVYAAGMTATIAGVGTLVVNADGSFVFTPVANYNGTVPTVTYEVCEVINLAAAGTLQSSSPNIDRNTHNGEVPAPWIYASGSPDTFDVTTTVFGYAWQSSPMSGGDFLHGIGSPISAADEGFSQTLSGLTPGAQYEITFWQAISNNTWSNAPGATGHWDVTFGGMTQAASSLVNPALGTSVAWVQQTLTFTAMSAAETITFVARNDGANRIDLGIDDVTVRHVGGMAACSTAALNITVLPANDAPTAVNDTASVIEDMPATGNVLSGLGADSDIDGDTLSVTSFDVPGLGSFTAGQSATLPGVGVVSIHSTGAFSFAPAANYDGPVPPITYTIADGNGGSDTAVLALVIVPVDDPVVNDLPVDWTTTEDTTIPLVGLSVDDPDFAGTVTVTLNVPAADGTLSGANAPGVTVTGSGTNQIVLSGTIADINAALRATPPSFTPAHNFNGDVTLKMTSSEVGAALPLDLPAINGIPSEGTAPAGWSIASATPDIIAGNGPWPGGYGYVTSNVSGLSPQGGEMGLFLNNANGPGESWATTLNGLTTGQTYTVALTWQQAQLSGGATYVGGQMVVIVDGVSTLFTGSATPSTDTWQTAIVTFTASGATASFSAGILSSGSNGAIVIDSGMFLSPAVDVDTRVIHVLPANDAPVAVDDTANVTEDTIATGNVLTGLGADGDIDGDALTVTSFDVPGVGNFTAGQSAAIPGIGVLTIGSTGAFSFAPALNYDGPVPAVTYTLSDGHGGTDQGVLQLVMQPVNDAPSLTLDPNNISGGADDGGYVATFTEGDAPVAIVHAAIADTFDPDNNITALTMYVGPRPDGNAEVISVLGVSVPLNTFKSQIVTFAGEQFQINYNRVTGRLDVSVIGDPDGTSHAVFDQILRTFTYENTSQAPSSVDRTFTFEMVDYSGYVSSQVVATVHVAPVNDGPVAANDANSVSEDGPSATGNVITDLLGKDTDVDGGALTISAGGQGANALTVGQPFTTAGGGVLTLNANGTYTFAPGAAYNGLAVGAFATETISYTVSDGNGGSASAVLVIAINGANDAPVVVDPANPGDPANPTSAVDPTHIIPDVTRNDGQPLAPIQVGQYFRDPDGDPLTFALDPGSTPSWLSINPVTGELTGTPPSNASQLSNTGTPGKYVVSIKATDPTGGSVTTTVTLVIANLPPLAIKDIATVSEDGPLLVGGNVLGNDSDTGSDNDPIRVGGTVTGIGMPVDGIGLATAVAGHAGGTFIVQTNGAYTFDPGHAFEDLAPGETRRTSVTYVIYDDNGGSSTATLTVIVTGENDAPTLIDPATGLPGDPATTALLPTVAAQDGAPITPVSIGAYLGDPDASQGAPTLSVDANALPPGITFDPSTGVFAGTPLASASNGGNVPGMPGVYRIPVTATDALGASVTTTITFTLTNPAPIAQADDVTTVENAPVTGSVLADNGHGSDVGGPLADMDPIRVGGVISGTQAPVDGIGVATPIMGSGGGTFVVQANGSFAFNPGTAFDDLAPGETRVTEVTYRLVDDNGGASTATLTVTVKGANDAPQVIDPVTGLPANPSTSVLPPVVASDGMSITPVGIGSYFRDLDSSQGAPSLSVDATALPQGITFDPSTGTFSGTPSRDASQGGTVPGHPGVYRVAVTATDVLGASVTTYVTFTVGNLPPSAAHDFGTAHEDAAQLIGSVLGNDTDGGLDTDPLTVTSASQNGMALIVGQPFVTAGGGQLLLNADGTYTFTPGTAYNGLAIGETATETISYGIADGNGGTATATLTITVEGSNDGPVVIDPSNPGVPDNPIPAGDPLRVLAPVTATDGATPAPVDVGAIIKDPDGDPLLFTATGLPPGLSIDPATGVIAGTLTADASQSGPYTVRVTATDPLGASIVTEVVYNVLNLAPVATDDTGAADRGQPTTIAVLANDTDGGPDSDPLTVVLATAEHGTVTINADGTLTFAPDWGYEGEALIRYRISDGNGGIADAVVRVMVTADPTAVLLDTPAPDAPRAEPAIERLTVSGMVVDTVRATTEQGALGRPGVNGIIVDAVRDLTRDMDSGTPRPAASYDLAGLSGFSLKFTGAPSDPVVTVETLVRKNVLILNLGTAGFMERDGAIEWKVQRVDGRPMPDWLHFTGRNVLMGERAANAEMLELRITAILPNGTPVSRDVRINTPTGEMQPLRLGQQSGILPFWEQIQVEPLLRQAQIEDLGRMLQAAE